MGTAFRSARDLFGRSVSVPSSQIDLLNVSLAIAAWEYPDLDVVSQRGRVSLLAEEAAALLPRRHGMFDAIHALNRVLYVEQGIRGNQRDYYDRRNSYLPDVLNRGLGNPITLSVLYMEMGRRIGYRFQGIGLPGHFLVRGGSGAETIYVDPFDCGGLLSRRECVGLVQRAIGRPSRHGAALTPEEAEAFLRPAGRRSIVRRMLTNLKKIHLHEHDHVRALRAAEAISIVEPTSWHNLGDLARIQTELGRFDAAAETLATYLKRAPRGHDLASARAALQELQGRAGTQRETTARSDAEAGAAGTDGPITNAPRNQ